MPAGLSHSAETRATIAARGVHRDGRLAQLGERSGHIRKVAGSSPASPKGKGDSIGCRPSLWSARRARTCACRIRVRSKIELPRNSAWPIELSSRPAYRLPACRNRQPASEPLPSAGNSRSDRGARTRLSAPDRVAGVDEIRPEPLGSDALELQRVAHPLRSGAAEGGDGAAAANENRRDEQ